MYTALEMQAWRFGVSRKDKGNEIGTSLACIGASHFLGGKSFALLYTLGLVWVGVFEFSFLYISQKNRVALAH
jgi:hypothetical protein